MATTATKNETSVMMSLRELRAIDLARRVDEAMARERAIADAKRREDEAQAARRAAEAQAIAARAEQERRAREAVELAAREAELRVREAEVRARAAADAAIATQRLEQEMDLRRAQISRTRPKALFAVIGVFAAAAIALGFLYASRSGDADALTIRLAQTQAATAAQATRIAGLEQARHGTENVIGGLRAQLHAVGQALLDHPPAVTSTTTATVIPHRHGHGQVTTTTTTTTTTGAIDLGDCARQPLLCGK
jgi:hypothetical protein